jgi:hypothetical protein
MGGLLAPSFGLASTGAGWRPVASLSLAAPGLAGGRLRLPTWGGGDPANDIALAYEKAAARVLAARPSYLIFAQGITAVRARARAHALWGSQCPMRPSSRLPPGS